MNSKQLIDDAIEIYNQGCGYIYGTAGQKWTKAAYEQLKKEKANDKNYTNSIKYGEKWVGKTVYDCSGLVKAICLKYGYLLSHGSNSQYKECKEKGLIESTIKAGALVFKLRNNTDFYHVGIYIGDGEVIEAKSAYKGVVKSNIEEWTHYGYLSKLDFTESEEREEEKTLSEFAEVYTGNDGKLNVRSNTSINAKVQDKLENGTGVEVLADVGGWAKIRYNKTGYVMSKYLKEVEVSG